MANNPNTPISYIIASTYNCKVEVTVMPDEPNGKDARAISYPPFSAPPSDRPAARSSGMADDLPVPDFIKRMVATPPGLSVEERIRHLTGMPPEPLAQAIRDYHRPEVHPRFAVMREQRERELAEEARQRQRQEAREAKQDAERRQTHRWVIAGVVVPSVLTLFSFALAAALQPEHPIQWWNDAKAAWAGFDLPRIQVPFSDPD